MCGLVGWLGGWSGLSAQIALSCPVLSGQRSRKKLRSNYKRDKGDRKVIGNNQRATINKLNRYHYKPTDRLAVEVIGTSKNGRRRNFEN